MKKILLLGLLITVLINAKENETEISKDKKQEIKEWVQTNFPADEYGYSVQKDIMEDEIKSYEWLQENLKDEEIKKNLEINFPASEFGYNAVMLIYLEEEKNKIIMEK